VIHDRQRLPLLLKATEHRFGIHAGIDELERDLLLIGHLALGEPHNAEAAGAEFLDEAEGADHVTRLLELDAHTRSSRRERRRCRGSCRRRCVKDFGGLSWR